MTAITKTDYVLILIALIAMFNCIIRSDFNIVIALVCHFFWMNRENKVDRVATVIKILLIIVEVFDIIWLIVVWSAWTTQDSTSVVWNSLRFWHVAVIFSSIVNFFVKIAAFAFVSIEGQETNAYNKL